MTLWFFNKRFIFKLQNIASIVKKCRTHFTFLYLPIYSFYSNIIGVYNNIYAFKYSQKGTY